MTLLRPGFLLAAVPLVMLATRPAEACSGGGVPGVRVMPAAGSTQVSTGTSIVVLGPASAGGITLSAGGQPVDLPAAELLGSSNFGKVWKFSTTDLLAPSTSYTVTVPGANATTATFTTASGYDKAPGTPPALESVRLWRVRYPVAEIGSGNCVSSEYVGFAEIRWKAAVIPNTAPESTLHTFSLSPRHGGAAQSFLVLGAGPQLGAEPAGDHPFPLQDWNPQLDPTQEYCVTVSAQGDGDKVRPTSASQTVCACVEQRSTAGAPPPPVIEGGCGAGAGGSGGAAGQAGSAGASGAGQAGSGAGGEAGGAGQGGSEQGGAGQGGAAGSGGESGGSGQAGAASYTPAPSTPNPGDGACALAGRPAPGGWQWAALGALALWLGRRRR